MTTNPIIKEDLNYIYNSNIDWSIFRNTSILITGANGFLPAYLVEFFLYLNNIIPELNIKVFGLVRNENKAKERFKDHLKNKNLELIIQDVCDEIKIKENIDYIFHAASQASPKFYGLDPVGTLYPNIIGTINLLNFSKSKNVKSFLYFSSGEVYGEVKSKSIDENNYGYLDPTNIRSCYAESKRMGENICISFNHQFGINVKIVRPFHTYGPGMALDDGRVFADFVNCIIKKNEINLNSDGSSIRCFCYLSDATIGFIKVLLDGIPGQAYNLGNPKEEISILNLANMLTNLYPEYNLKIKLKNQINSKGYLASKVQKISPNIGKIMKLGWSPEINLAKGFKRTIDSFLYN
jgi:UDP-glucuronate decarboxylase